MLKDRELYLGHIVHHIFVHTSCGEIFLQVLEVSQGNTP